MRAAGSEGRIGGKASQALLGWVFATFLVAVALFGPPLTGVTGQKIPTLMELRHNILMIDWEFERWSIRTNTSFTGTSTPVQDDLRRAGSTRSTTQFGGGVS
jgi:hypothetical protein